MKRTANPTFMGRNTIIKKKEDQSNKNEMGNPSRKGSPIMSRTTNPTDMIRSFFFAIMRETRSPTELIRTSDSPIIKETSNPCLMSVATHHERTK